MAQIDIEEFPLEEVPLSCTWLMNGGPGSGKCVSPDTPILLFDGAVKLAKSLEVGDRLMGDDGTSRTIQSVCVGRGPMFRVTMVEDGDTYVVNGPHVLCLRDRDEVTEMTAEEYLDLPKERRDALLGYRVPVEFEERKFDIDPYVVGFIAGRLHSDRFQRNAKAEYKFRRRLRVEQIPFDVEERIPDEYRICSTEQRLDFLAGLLDTNHGLSFTSLAVAEDVTWIARSVGLQAVISRGKGSCSKWTVTVKGFMSTVPTFSAVHDEYTDRSSNITVEPLEEGDYCGFEIDGNKRFVLGNLVVTHNTTLMENIAYSLKHRYPVARAFIGTESGYKRFCDIFHPLYVSNYYSEDEQRQHIVRQRKCELENGHKYPGNYAINIIDDASDDPRVYKTKTIRGLFKLGSQHYNQLTMVGSQYPIDLPPDIRKSISYVAIFREPEEEERKKLYKNFGGIAGSYQNFCDIMDQLTGDYTCVIFVKRTQSNRMEECVYWLRTKVLGKWKFGCKEYREWAKKRYNENYVEEIIV